MAGRPFFGRLPAAHTKAEENEAEAIVDHAAQAPSGLLAVREHVEMPPVCATARDSDGALDVR